MWIVVDVRKLDATLSVVSVCYIGAIMSCLNDLYFVLITVGTWTNDDHGMDNMWRKRLVTC